MPSEPVKHTNSYHGSTCQSVREYEIANYKTHIQGVEILNMYLLDKSIITCKMYKPYIVCGTVNNDFQFQNQEKWEKWLTYLPWR